MRGIALCLVRESIFTLSGAVRQALSRRTEIGSHRWCNVVPRMTENYRQRRADGEKVNVALCDILSAGLLSYQSTREKLER